jgi:hypothetical protein
MLKKIWLLALVGAAVLLTAASALADGDFYVVGGGGAVGTKINSLPYPINQSGFYYLGGNLTYTGGAAAIIVNVNDVTIDLMGFSLLSTGALNSIGISIPGRKNVEVRNGTVSGFNADGIYDSSGGYSYRFINLRLELNDLRGIALLNGRFHLIQNCTITENGNSGIGLSGNGHLVTGNVVSKNFRGIACTGSGHSLVGNVVAENTNYGFDLSATGTYLIDRNTAYNNGAGNINVFPSAATFGINAGAGMTPP